LQHIAWIIALGNLLGFLAQAGGMVFNYFHAPPNVPLWVFWVNLLAVAVFLSQRSYARMMAREWAEEDDGNFEPEVVTIFYFWTEWMERPLFPWLLILCNVFFVGLMAVSLAEHADYLGQMSRLSQDISFDPTSKIILSLSMYKGGLAVANILFTALAAFGFRRSAWVLGPLALVAAGLWVMNYPAGQEQALAEQVAAEWPVFETITLTGGLTMAVTPPPGYVRIEVDNPAVEAYLKRFLTHNDGSRDFLVAVFVENGQRYEEIKKNLVKPVCDYNCESGLAWVYQSVGRSSGRIIGLPYILKHSGRDFLRLGDLGPVASDLYVDGQVMVSGRILRTRAVYGFKGALQEEQTQHGLDHSRQWLEALAEANPSTAVEVTP
jgi:hypothetical protein